MADSPNPPELINAYRLVKAGQKSEAAQILRVYLSQNARDARAWWLMAHVVDKPDNVRRCLENVLTLDPAHAKAREKLALLSAPAPSTSDEPDDAFFGVSSAAPRSPSKSAPRRASQPAPRTATKPSAAPTLSTQDFSRVAARPSSDSTPTPTFEEFLKTEPAFADPFAASVADDPFADIPTPVPGRGGQAAGTGNQPDWGPGLAFVKDGTTGAAAKPGGRLGFNEPAVVDDERQSVERLIKLGLIGLAIVVLVGLVIYAIVEFGGGDAGVPSMTALEGGSFSIDYPKKWDMRCASDVNGYPVCGIANHESYNDVDWFAGKDVDLGAMIAEGFGDALFSDYSDLPADRISIIVMDVPRTSSSIDLYSWAKTAYESVQRDPASTEEAEIEYSGRQDITVDGSPAGYYKFTYEGDWTAAAWDVYVEHDGIILWMVATFWTDSRARIPEATIQAMIDSIDLKPVEEW